MNLNKRTLIIIAVTFAVLSITAIAIALTVQQQKQSDEQEKRENAVYEDPGSKEIIITDDKSTQGSDESLRDNIIYPGFYTLLDRGLSPAQIQSVQSTLASYSATQETKFKEVSLTLDSLRHVLPQGQSTEHKLTFDIKVNRTDDYFVSVAYKDTQSCVTTLYKADKTTQLIGQ